MAKSIISEGKTTAEAIEKGLNEMQLTRLKAHIKVVSREKHGFLGFLKAAVIRCFFNF